MISKKIINIILTSVLLIGALTGCANGTKGGREVERQSETQATIDLATDSTKEDETSVETAELSGEGRNVLVVYYSATGTTAAVANSLAELMEGAVFELEPVEPYSSEELNWRDNNSRVSQEYQNPESRDIALVTETVDNWEIYDTVFIGYPIWWGIAAWPINGFVETNDFTGKTVIPFCTSSSSGFGESGELLEKLAGTGTWLAGERFRSGTTAEELQAWIDGLGL